MTEQPEATDRATGSRFARLPDRVHPKDWVEEQSSSAPHDPNGGRDPETDWMLRNTGG